MKTDALFYDLFQSAPELLFELLGFDASLARSYRMDSVEIKQTAFRLDGVFLPAGPDRPLYFLECQYQKDADFYLRLFGQIALYCRRKKYRGDWCAVVLFARRSLDPGVPVGYRAFEVSGQVQRLYMQEQAQSGSLVMEVLQLLPCPRRRLRAQVAAVVERVEREIRVERQRRQIMEWVETIVVEKFPELSAEEIAKMLKSPSLRRTRVFQEALAEGRQAQAVAMTLRLLQHRLGALSSELSEQIGHLPLGTLDELSLALLEFDSEAQVRRWLEQHG